MENNCEQGFNDRFQDEEHETFGSPPPGRPEHSDQENLFKRYLTIMGEDPQEYFMRQQFALGEDGMAALPENQQKEMLAQALHGALRGQLDVSRIFPFSLSCLIYCRKTLS